MASFEKTVVIHTPVQRLFAFHEREDALPLLTPKFPPARLISKTGGIMPGSQVVLRVGFINWVALHTEYIPNRLFVDEQVSGPFARWIHRHEFEPMGEWSRLTDRIDYELYGGPIVNACLGWAVNIALRQMFGHRHEVTQKYCEQ